MMKQLNISQMKSLQGGVTAKKVIECGFATIGFASAAIGLAVSTGG